MDDWTNLVRILETWPSDKIFPALDILRLAVINESISSVVRTEENFERIFHLFVKNVINAGDSCTMLAGRGLTNMFTSQQGK